MTSECASLHQYTFQDEERLVRRPVVTLVRGVWISLVTCRSIFAHFSVVADMVIDVEMCGYVCGRRILFPCIEAVSRHRRTRLHSAWSRQETARESEGPSHRGADDASGEVHAGRQTSPCHAETIQLTSIIMTVTSSFSLF